MIILKVLLCSPPQSVQVELPRANMVIDPRPIGGQPSRPRWQCHYHDNGTTVTLTMHECYREGVYYWLRVYDPATETVPSFDSTIYTYMGEDCEEAPFDTTEVIIHPSVTVIKDLAFAACEEIQKCYMHDGVHTIKNGAFESCSALKVIRLSRSLTHIGSGAFEACSSLEAVFLPPSVNKIDKWAFVDCTSLRIFPLPLYIDISQIGEGMLLDCDNFFKTTNILQQNDDFDLLHQEIIHFYRDQVPPLHKVCHDTHVTHQTIQQCVDTHGWATASITDHDGMTPLHILAMNPHADIGAILACFDLNMISLFVEDSKGNTPMDYLGVYHNGIEYHTSLISSLCMHRDAASRGA